MKQVVFESVVFSYPADRDFAPAPRVFDRLSLTLKPGRAYVLLGPNGCGKSTFAKLMAGIICPDEGRVLIGGDEVSKMSLPEVGRSVGIVMQNPSRQLICSRPVDEVAFGLVQRGMDRDAAGAFAAEALESYGLSEASGTYTQRLSKGEQIRLAMASWTVLKPDWMILDESLSSLDICSKGIVLGKVAEMAAQGHGVIVVSHSSELADEMGAVKITMEKGGAALVG